MKAAYIEQTGPPEVITFGELEKPRPGSGQVLVRTGAVSVNPIDTYIRNGANYWPLPTPYVIGCDIAGVVEEVGGDVTRYQVGDRVWGSNQGLMGRQGTFAEFCAIDEQWLYPLPEGVTDETAAATALVGITAHLGLFRDGELKAGETVFVQGGSGGVGSTVLQMAKAAGARVIASAGSAQKAQICHELGADQVVRYDAQDVVSAVKQFATDGVQLYWETRREPDLDVAVNCMSERGRLILMAGRDARPAFPLGPFYVKGCRAIGFVMFKATADEQRECADRINDMLVAGRLKPRIDTVLPLCDAAEAHRRQEASTVRQSGQLAGKLVLIP
ncbi:MAG: NADPH:quinone reductase [Pirellulaceae bacterium]|nr:NADPH:quinone reductase [Planctomycetales bacterium]